MVGSYCYYELSVKIESKTKNDMVRREPIERINSDSVQSEFNYEQFDDNLDEDIEINVVDDCIMKSKMDELRILHHKSRSQFIAKCDGLGYGLFCSFAFCLKSNVGRLC